MDALLVIDMQCGLLDGTPKLDLPEVVVRINQLAAAVRRRSGTVIWVQHAGSPGDPFEPGTPGWALLPDLHRHDADAVVSKTLNDAFAQTNLAALLGEIGADRLLICGWATDFCVDATFRSAVSGGFHVVAVSDGHTAGDRPHLSASAVVRHHNWVWANLIPSRSIAVATTAELLAVDEPSANAKGR